MKFIKKIFSKKIEGEALDYLVETLTNRLFIKFFYEKNGIEHKELESFGKVYCEFNDEGLMIDFDLYTKKILHPLYEEERLRHGLKSPGWEVRNLKKTIPYNQLIKSNLDITGFIFCT